MKKLEFLVLILAVCSLLTGEMSISADHNEVTVNYRNEDLLNSPASMTSILALPALQAEIEVTSCEIKTISAAGEILESRNSEAGDRVQLVDDFVMRELYGHTVRIDLKAEVRGENEVVSNLEFKLRAIEPVETPQTVSMVYQPLYEQMVDNYEQSYFRDAELVTPSMLIITPPQIVGTLQPFIEWKHERGISTQIATLEDTGPTAPDIKAYIQNIYDTEETPPDYVLIFGDGDEGFFVVPPFFINSTGETDVTDHPYTMLEGDDYFPEMIIGRISIDTTTELQRIITKILAYEKYPYLDSNWFENGLIVAGNYSSSPPIPTTPVKVSQWLRDKMDNYGYNNITEVYYPPTNDGVTAINGAMNEGVGFVSYRGWGDANGWHKPEYHTEDMANLNNGFQLPIMTSIVCNTGDFVNSVDPCFGEAMLRAHIGTTPKGAVAVIAPSDLHTSTKYNNSIFSGFYSGVLDEGIHSFGAAVLRGKYQLYTDYPLNWEQGDYVEFYFHVYNILGDPSIQMWTKTPQEMTLGEALPSEIGMGANFLEIELPGYDGAVVSATQGDEMAVSAISDNGSALLMLDDLSMGELKVTVVKPDHLPLMETIEVVQHNVDIGIEEYSVNNDLAAGMEVDLSVILHNYGTESSTDLNGTLASESEYITVSSAEAAFGTLAPGASQTGEFQFTIGSDCPDGEMVVLDLDLETYGTRKFHFNINSLMFDVTGVQINDANGIADPGETVEMEITLHNSGSVDAPDLQATVTALSDAVTIENGLINFGSVNVNSSAAGSFDFSVDGSCLVGRTVSFLLEMTDAEGRETELQVPIEIGDVQNTDPTFSPAMDYFIYDSFDTGYAEAPGYSWLEIDPQEGGEGEVTLMPDDHSESYPLPFTFTYYGIDYDSLTICTNGWISFETTWMTLFRNWNMPGPLGPYAMVAAFWDDLIGEPFMVGDSLFHHDMRICRYYNEAENTFIIEWNECVARFDDETVEKFQIVLYDPAHYQTVDGNGEIQVNYQIIDNVDATKNYATVGIEDHTQMNGVLYTYADIYPASATELQDELAIKFTTDPPDTFTGSDETQITPNKAKLYANYPNPFNPVTTISFQLHNEISKDTGLVIYNLKGQKVKELTPDVSFKGIEGEAYNYSVDWNGSDDSGRPVSSGIYYYRLTSEGSVQTRKCVLIK